MLVGTCSFLDVVAPEMGLPRHLFQAYGFRVGPAT